LQESEVNETVSVKKIGEFKDNLTGNRYEVAEVRGKEEENRMK